MVGRSRLPTLPYEEYIYFLLLFSLLAWLCLVLLVIYWERMGYCLGSAKVEQTFCFSNKFHDDFLMMMTDDLS